ncbi:MAG TPA: LysR family transcriptional regulator [Methylomirabilota bacterium]|nr:LysR family transcriptional regulator [Methylomirabilota bacterium]
MKTPLDSRQLRAFVATARSGSFTVAAKQLFLSQSAMSHSIKALEEDVGCRLFDRVGKSVQLTLAGEQLLQSAERILGQMEMARASLQHLGKWGRTQLRVAGSVTVCEHIFPSALRLIRERDPNALIHVHSADTGEAIDLLAEKQIGVAIALQPKADEQLEFRPLFQDELCFIMDPSHSWAQKKEVVRSELGRQRFIFYSRTSYTSQLIQEYFAEEEVELNSALEMGSMTATKELVKQGLGISIVAPWIAQRELKEGSLLALPLGRRKLKRTWGALVRKNQRLSMIEETFIARCESTAKVMVLRLD